MPSVKEKFERTPLLSVTEVSSPFRVMVGALPLKEAVKLGIFFAA